MESSLLSLLASIDLWQALAIAAKSMLYITCFVASGGMFFLVLFSSFITETERGQISRGIYWACFAGIILSGLRIVIMDDMLSGEWSGMANWDMTRAILNSREGMSLVFRLTGFCLVLLLFRRRALRWLLIPLLAGTLAIPVSLGIVGHASELALQIGWIPQTMIYLHLFAVTFWLGALWPLYRTTDDTNISRVAAVMEQFGKIAVFVVSALLLAGIILLLELLRSPPALWQSVYGRFMLLKLVCVVCLLMLAALNKLRYTTALAAGDVTALISLRKSIRVEMGVACLILLTTAGLTTLVGPPALN